MSDATISPTPSLMPLITSYIATQAVHVAARIGLADRLQEDTASVEALARATETHGPSLRRLLHALAGLGLVEAAGCDRFRLTPLGAQLRSDAPDSLRAFALLLGSEPAWRSVGELTHSVCTGETAFERVFGTNGFAYLAAHPEQAANFNDAMTCLTRQVAPAIGAACQISGPATVVDVGGGNGTLLAAILEADPALRGVVFDSPSGVAGSLRYLDRAGLADRCQVVAGDFFQEVPSGADVYVLKSVIHDWDDAHATQILRVCRRAMRPRARLLLVESVLPEKIQPEPMHQQIVVLDLLMLAVNGGRERTAAEFQSMFAASDFELARILPVERTAFSVIEASPRAGATADAV